MIPWLNLDTGQIPGGGELRLKRRGAEFSIRLDNNELMNSRLSGSEEALATLTAERLKDRKAPQVLIGGLGMGFTLKAALGAFDAQARFTVAELVPAVIAWAHGPMAELFGDSLADPRVTIAEADVRDLIASAKGGYDAILLDVDNGPEAMTRKSNDRLYDMQGLALSLAALKPGGILAVWSMGPDAGFTQRLRKSGFGVEEIGVRAHRSRSGTRHVIWLAKRK